MDNADSTSIRRDLIDLIEMISCSFPSRTAVHFASLSEKEKRIIYLLDDTEKIVGDSFNPTQINYKDYAFARTVINAHMHLYVKELDVP